MSPRTRLTGESLRICVHVSQSIWSDAVCPVHVYVCVGVRPYLVFLLQLLLKPAQLAGLADALPSRLLHELAQLALLLLPQPAQLRRPLLLPDSGQLRLGARHGLTVSGHVTRSATGKHSHVMGPGGRLSPR